MRRSLLCLLAPIAFTACSPVPDPASTPQEDMIAVARLMATLDRVMSEEALEELVDYIAADAVLMPRAEPAVVGRRAIAAWYRSLFQRFDVELTHQVLEIDVLGGYILHRGNVAGTLTPRDGGRPTLLDRKYLLVIRRGPDGRMELWRSIANDNSPQPGDPAIDQSGSES